MSSTKLGIVYSTVSKMIRRVIVPDNDKQLEDQSHIGNGETMLVVSKDVIQSPSDIYSQVELAIGKKPQDITCAIVDKNGSIVRLIKADPAIDAIEDHDLIPAPDEVDISAKYDKVTGKFLIPEKIIPAGIDKLGNDIPEQIISAKYVDAISVDVAEIIV
jgi:hypothetical protein